MAEQSLLHQNTCAQHKDAAAVPLRLHASQFTGNPPGTLNHSIHQWRETLYESINCETLYALSLHAYLLFAAPALRQICQAAVQVLEALPPEPVCAGVAYEGLGLAEKESTQGHRNMTHDTRGYVDDSCHCCRTTQAVPAGKWAWCTVALIFPSHLSPS